ncbi:MAG: hypothetical protein RL095_1242 [Verrucomicrobiota bacterium]|jgi:hypothetical protein
MKLPLFILIMLITASCSSSKAAVRFPAKALPYIIDPEDAATKEPHGVAHETSANKEPLFLLPLPAGEESGLQKPDGSWLPLVAEFEARCEGPFCQVKARLTSPEEAGLCRLIYRLPRQSAVTDLVLSCGRRKFRAIALPPEQIRRVTAAANEQGLACQILEIDQFQRMILLLRRDEAASLQLDFRYLFAASYVDGKFHWALPAFRGLQAPPRLKLEGAERDGDKLCFSATATASSLSWRDTRGRGLHWDAEGLKLIEPNPSANNLPVLAEALLTALRMSQNPGMKDAYLEGLLLPETGAVFVR